MIAVGALDVVLAVIVLAVRPWSALTLPGYVLGISFLFSGMTSVASALAHKKSARAFSV